MELYINENASASALLDFVKNELGPADTEMHAFMLYHKGDLMAKMIFDPYSAEDKRQVYSVSKTFSSTAIGIACDMGLLTVDDKLVDIFPDKLPDTVSDKLVKLTVKHILTMTDGHSECSMKRIADSDDGVKAYFNHEFTLEPGTEYLYNTGASYMLSAIITRLTGLTLLDFLNQHLFEPLGITNVSWPTAGGNINEGGAGLRICADDLAKVALMYASKGVYDGKRILSEKWIDEATAYHSTGQLNRDPDWKSGYGYQIWRNVRGGYRADGAFGQYFIVIPEKDITMIFLCESHNVDAQLPLCFDLADSIFDPDSKREAAENELKAILRDTYTPLGGNAAKEVSEHYELEPNLNGYVSADIKCSGDVLTLNLNKETSTDTINFGNARYIENNVTMKGFLPQLYSLVPAEREEECRFLASFEQTDSGAKGELRYLNCAHTVGADINFDDKDFSLNLTYYGDLVPPGGFKLKGNK